MTLKEQLGGVACRVLLTSLLAEYKAWQSEAFDQARAGKFDAGIEELAQRLAMNAGGARAYFTNWAEAQGVVI